MAGNQSRALRIASLTRGWDSTKIPAGNGQPAQDLARFDVDQGNLAGRPVGSLPGGTPDTWRDGYDTDPSRLRFDAPVPFATPDTTRETVSRRTSSANPVDERTGAPDAAEGD